MKKIKDIISKPSEALEAMVNGLINQNKRLDFEIDMNTFGVSEDSICYGCAATCAIQEICGINLNKDNINEFDDIIRSEALNIEIPDLDKFEDAINFARMGILLSLFYYFDLKNKWNKKYDDRFYLSTHNWQSELPKVQQLIEELKQENL